MKTLFRKTLVWFVVLSLLIGQTMPALAQENTLTLTPTPLPEGEGSSTPEETGTPTEEVTETPIAGGETPTEPVITETPTPEFTETPTPELTETPITGSETPTPELTETPITGSETPITGSETPTEEPTEVPQAAEIPQHSLTLSSSPAFLTAGGLVNLHWTIEGEVSAENPLMLEIMLPAGFEAKKKTDQERFDPATGLYATPVTAAQGTLLVQTTQAVVEDAFFSARLLRGEEILAVTSFILPLHEQFEIGTGGGSAHAMNGRVKITFPAGALNEDIILTAGFPAFEHLPDEFSHKIFELKALSKSDAAVEIAQFNTPLTIEADYSDLELTEDQEDELYLYWYNEETGDWHALESYRDKDTKTLRAYTDHFTLMDIGVNDWRASRLPTTESFQVSKFTGAATFSLPIEVPPGPGGFQPNITLAYNSQVVDQATTKAQASWVGMGWSLDGGGGSITENGDGKGYMLVVNGVSTQLIRETEGGDYHTMEENYWKITRVDNGTDDYWKVFDTQGNVYFFNTKQKYAYYDTASGTYKRKTFSWHLTSATNAHGQAMTYSYAYEYNKNVGNTRTDTAVYIDAITYPGGSVRVRFVREARTDYKLAYDTDEAVHLYEKSRLSHIIVEQDGDGNGSFEKKFRKYEFTYIGEENGGSLSDRIWPNVNYSAGGDALTLRTVQEWGWQDGGWNVSLPAYRFNYDNLHLTSASNGYGGKVTFVYEDEPWYSTTTPADYTKSATPCPEGGGISPWVIREGSTASCSQAGQMTVTNSAVATSSLSSGLVRPGGVYQVTFTGTRTSGSVIQVGTMYRVGMQYAQLSPTHSFSYVVRPHNKNASTLHTVFKATGTGRFTKAELKLLPSFYRVTLKTVYDGSGKSYRTEYDYGSPLVASADYEFRGHGVVTETAPDRTVTKTYFYQDDARKGRTKRIEVYTGGILRSKTVTTYLKTDLTEHPISGKYEHAWVFLDSQANYIYNNNGQQAGGTYTKFSYAILGNLTKKEEYGNPTGAGTPYRTTEITYNPKDGSGIYIISAPEMQQVKDGGGNLLAETRYYYNGSTCLACAPTANIVTMTRVKMDASLYAQTNYAYDEWGNQTGMTVYSQYSGAGSPPSGGAQTTTTDYDKAFHAYPVSVTNELEQSTSFTYDYAKGVPTSITDPNGATTAAAYDAFGRITKLYRPDLLTGLPETSASISIGYNDDDGSFTFPFATTITLNAMRYSITRKYDGMGREIETDAGGVVTATVYQSATETWQSLPYTGNESPQYTITTTEPSDRTTTVRAPDMTNTSIQVNGLTTTVTDAKERKTVSTSDVWGRVILVTPPTGPGVEYVYDELNNMIKSIRGGATTSIDYDNAGRKTSMTDPDMGIWNYKYDALGSLTRQTDARGQTICMYYDALNRLEGKDYRMNVNCPAAPVYSVSYGYDATGYDNSNGQEAPGGNSTSNFNYGIGRRTSMNDASGSTSWVYDNHGRMVKETKAIGNQSYTTEYGYNSADLMTWMKYPDGEIVEYTYNPRMLLEELNGTQFDVTTPYASAMAYDAAGRLTSRLLGNGLTQTLTYNPWTTQGGRLQNLTTGVWDRDTSAFTSKLQDLSYTYDPVGNITKITDLLVSETQTFNYDTLDRLIRWKLNGTLQEVYTYDEATGNLLTKGAPTPLENDLTVGALQYQYDPEHAHAVRQLVGAANENELGNSYLYNANGSQTRRTVGEDVFDLTYNAENRLKEVKKNNAVIAHFTYDGDGRRVKSVMEDETILFVGAHYEVKGSEITKYYFAGATRIAMRKYTIPQSMSVEYFLSDHLGSTSITTDADGNKVSEMRYTPWGEVRSAWTAELSTTPVYQLTKHTFTGQYSHMDDPTTENVTEGFGLMDYGARMYDPALGRFTSADTIIPSTQGVQGWDRYAYVNNNPVRYSDPTGHIICAEVEVCNPGSGTNPGSGSTGSGSSSSGGNSGAVNDNDPDLCNTFGECGNTSSNTLLGPLPEFPDTQYICESLFSGAPLFCNSNVVKSTSNNIFSTFSDTFSSPDTFDYFSMLFEVSNLRGWTPVKIPGVFGMAMDYTNQMTINANLGIPTLEANARATVAVAEGQVIAYISTGASGLSAVGSTPTGPGVAAVMITTYIASSVALSSLAETINSNYIFPALHEALAK